MERINFPASLQFFGEEAFTECTGLMVTIEGENRAAERYCVLNNLEYEHAENE
jgi:hypothetical protein